MHTGMRRPSRQDTFDLSDQIHTDEYSQYSDPTYPSDEEHSVLEDDSDAEDTRDDYAEDDDGSSSLSIPNESIDFDLVYALHSFAATVEGQANVVKGDSLFLMDDSNSYWWLVRVLKTQEVGYIPAENIETPFERLARLNKHRNVDLASATQAELRDRDDLINSRERLHANTTRIATTPSPARDQSSLGASETPGRRSVAFTPSLSVHRYPPAVWNEEEEEDEDEIEWDLEGYEDEDPELADEQAQMENRLNNMEPDDGMSWEGEAVEEMQASSRQARAAADGVPNSLVSSGSGSSSGSLPLQQSSQQLQTDGIQLVLRSRESQERILAESTLSTSAGVDPINATETRKITVTPSVARDPGLLSKEEPRQLQPAQVAPSGPLLPSAIMQQQQEERKRTREEIEALEEAARKRSKGKEQTAVSSGGKLRKDRESDEESNKEKDRKSRGGIFSGIFGRKKDKSKDRSLSASTSSDSDLRGSEESSHSSNQYHDSGSSVSPVTNSAKLQQQQQLLQQQQAVYRNVSDPRRSSQQSPRGSSEQISQHASQLRQYDQQQQQLFQQYLNRSPSSPPEPSYGLTSAPLMPFSNSYASSVSSNSNSGPGSQRPRPGSLVLSPTSIESQGVGVPELSVIRVFAGKHLETEATFKTVLLNSSTTASDLVRQAIQRFRLPAGEDTSSYYLTMKQVEGSSAVLRPDERPLGVFESLVEAALELPKVKRSSVGSISSISSNLSMHPAIKVLSMNDFTDDSAVKFYLNRRRAEGDDDSTDELMTGDDALAVDTSHGSHAGDITGQHLSVSPASYSAQERFSSPSFRFALQVVIYPDDLPDDMAFDTQTEAIVFKHTLRERPQSDISVDSGVSLSHRRKVFVFPKNIIVAEVIEIALERFGILEGVVDGGDEIEDKSSKRRSSSRVRYTLHIDVGGRDRELYPSSRVIDAYPRPPAYKSMERSSERKRRSIDSTLLLSIQDEVAPDDPVFVLRRAVAYRQSSSRRHSAPLDEIALQQLHRNSGSSGVSDVTVQNDDNKRQLSKQEIIAAQRVAQRANQQRAILSTQSNASRGVDVLLPGNAVIRSSRYETEDRIRYSYVEPDGEVYDISQIVEEELRSDQQMDKSETDLDLLQSVLKGKDVTDEKLGRVLNKIKDGKGLGKLPASQSSASSINESPLPKESSSPSLYSSGDKDSFVNNEASGSRSGTPLASAINARNPASNVVLGRVSSPLSRLANQKPNLKILHDRQNSIVSMLSELSGYRSTTPGTPPGANVRSGSVIRRPKPFIPKDDFGLSNMLAVIELGGSKRSPTPPPPDLVEELFFGKKLEEESLHPDVRDIYSDTFKQLDEMDKILDDLLQLAVHS